MRTAKLLMLLAALVMVAVAAGYRYLATLDLGPYRDQLAAGISDLTGRSLHIDGELQMRPSWRPVMSVTGVRFGNAAWGSEADMLRVDRVDARLRLLPLLRGRIELANLAVRGAELLLETDPGGRQNWVLPAMAPGPDDAQGSFVPPAVQRLTVENLRIRWRTPASGQPAAIVLDSLRLQAVDPRSPMTLALAGTVDGRKLAVEGVVGSIASLVADQPFSIELRADYAGNTLTAEGDLERPLAETKVDLQLRAQGPEIADLAAPGEHGVPLHGPWSARFALRATGSAIALDDLAATIGTGDVNGRMDLRLDGDRPFLTVALHSTQLPLFAPSGPPAASPPDDGGPAPGRVFSPEPLALAVLDRLDARFEYQADRVSLGRLAFQDLRLDAVLDRGRLRVEPLRASFYGGRLVGWFELRGASVAPGMSGSLAIDGLDLGALSEAVVDQSPVRSRANAALQVDTQGTSPAEWAEHLEGSARFVAGAGQTELAAIDAIIGGVGTVLRTLVADSKRSAHLNCMVGQFEIHDGRARAAALLADTEHSTVVGSGYVDLGGEQVDLLLTPKPKSVTLSVATPVVIKGPLAAPDVSPERLAVARKTVGLLAAVGAISFPPAALLGLVELGSGDNNACLQALSSGHADAAGNADDAGTRPNRVEGALNRVGSGIKDTLDSVGQRLKGWFGDQ